MKRSLVLAAAVALPTLVPAASSARPAYVGQVPNTPAAGDCNTCHTSGGGTPRNPFGLAVEQNLQAGAVPWSKLFCLDSDGDGQTNGMELGDPCGVWATGDPPPRDADLSLPGDDTSTATTPEAGCPEGEAAPADCDETDVDDQAPPPGGGGGGCFGQSQLPIQPPLVALFAALLLGTARRRRGGA